ncbi:MAG TPA: hypothetical protein VHE55_10215 [Fimbriimonadaceae bacterium]|nr:hypothetical protein [Fimbriimonadaceae bacterium]
MMLRKIVFSTLLVPVLIGAQGIVKAPQADKTKVLDAAAKTPFFTQRGADAVKRVVAGGDAHKADEKALDPTPQGGPAQPGQPGLPGQLPPGQPQPNQQAPAPPPEQPFAWRLVGISYGKRKGMALFQQNDRNKSVFAGETLDTDVKVVTISRRAVVLLVHGKRIALMPW